MHRFSVHGVCLVTLTALAIACGGDDKNNSPGDSDNTVQDATQAQAAEAFPLFASAVQVAFTAGQSNTTPAASGFTFSAPATGCGLNGTYAITGTGNYADSAHPSAGGTYQFTNTWFQCATQTYAIDGDEDETVTVSQTTAGSTTATDEVIHATSAHLGFATIDNLRPVEEFNCGATDLNLHVHVTQTTGQAPVQTVTGSGTWCTFTWDNSFVGDYQFVPQAN